LFGYGLIERRSETVCGPIVIGGIGCGTCHDPDQGRRKRSVLADEVNKHADFLGLRALGVDLFKTPMVAQ
jgi:hypothetical protein